MDSFVTYINIQRSDWVTPSVHPVGKIVLRDVITRLCPSAIFEDMPSHVLQFLHSKNVPPALIAELNSSFVHDRIWLGPYLYSAGNQLIENNTGEPYGFFCDSGFLNIGFGTTGDHVALECATGRAFIVDHDQFAEYYTESNVPNPPDVRTRMVDPSMTLVEFWQQAATDPAFPADVYEAEQRWPRYLT